VCDMLAREWAGHRTRCVCVDAAAPDICCISCAVRGLPAIKATYWSCSAVKESFDAQLNVAGPLPLGAADALQ
jgi:hypothetical protein